MPSFACGDDLTSVFMHMPSAAGVAVNYHFGEDCSRLQRCFCCCRSLQTVCSWVIVRHSTPRSASSVRLLAHALTVAVSTVSIGIVLVCLFAQSW